MSETAILGTVVTALWGIVIALIGVVWSTLKERQSATDAKVGELERQNTQQETQLGRLTERAIAREEAHAQHREDTAGQISRIENAMTTGFSELGKKIDALMRGATPYPTRYAAKPGDSSDRGSR